MSVNSVSFGCNPLKKIGRTNTKSIADLTPAELDNITKKIHPNTEVKPNLSKHLSKLDKPELKVDKYGRVTSTREECEAFIKWAEENDVELLDKARANLRASQEAAKKALDEYNRKPAEYRRMHPLYSHSQLITAYGGITPTAICNEYVRLKKEAAAKAMGNSKPIDNFLGKIRNNPSNKSETKGFEYYA